MTLKQFRKIFSFSLHRLLVHSVSAFWENAFSSSFLKVNSLLLLLFFRNLCLGWGVQEVERRRGDSQAAREDQRQAPGPCSC